MLTTLILAAALAQSPCANGQCSVVRNAVHFVAAAPAQVIRNVVPAKGGCADVKTKKFQPLKRLFKGKCKRGVIRI